MTWLTTSDRRQRAWASVPAGAAANPRSARVSASWVCALSSHDPQVDHLAQATDLRYDHWPWTPLPSIRTS